METTVKTTEVPNMHQLTEDRTARVNRAADAGEMVIKAMLTDDSGNYRSMDFEITLLQIWAENLAGIIDKHSANPDEVIALALTQIKANIDVYAEAVKKATAKP